MAGKTDEAPPAQLKWPNKKEFYELKDVIGSGSTAVVVSAICTTNQQKVAIKRIDLDRYTGSIEELHKEIQLMSLCHHDNVMTYHTSFVIGNELWLVMKLMSGGSLLDILKNLHTKNLKGGYLDEVIIATVLKEMLQGLEYFHNNGQIHRDVKAGNIVLGEDGLIQLADFGVSTWLYDTGGKLHSKKAPRNTFVGTPCWMAPEVMEQSVGYNAKADIWSVGITALELATGVAPYAKFPPLKVIMVTLENPPPSLDTCGELNGEDYTKKYSKLFRKMVEKCLQKDPDKRPTATELLKNPFFKKARGKEFLKETLLSKTPSLTARAKKVKRVPGTSGGLHKTEQGGWVWSDDDLAEEDEPTTTSGDKKEMMSVSQSKLKPPQGDPKPTQVESTGDVAQVPATTGQPTVPIPQIITTTIAPSPLEPSRQDEDTSTTKKPSVDLSQLQQQEIQLKQQVDQLSKQLADLHDQREKLSTQLTDEHHQQKMEVLEREQKLQREYEEASFRRQQIARQLLDATVGSERRPSYAAVTGDQMANKTYKLALRLRDAKNQLKDIKFDFTVGVDKPDALASELAAAQLIDSRDLVVVAANISKFVENKKEKLIFSLSSQSTEKPDEKKLLGFAQLSIIVSSTV